MFSHLFIFFYFVSFVFFIILHLNEWCRLLSKAILPLTSREPFLKMSAYPLCSTWNFSWSVQSFSNDYWLVKRNPPPTQSFSHLFPHSQSFYWSICQLSPFSSLKHLSVGQCYNLEVIDHRRGLIRVIRIQVATPLGVLL